MREVARQHSPERLAERAQGACVERRFVGASPNAIGPEQACHQRRPLGLREAFTVMSTRDWLRAMTLHDAQRLASTFTSGSRW